MNKNLFLLLAAVSIQANAAGYVENRGVYATNPNEQFGQEKTIVIDGDPSDWTQDMIIAQGSANDMCTAFKGSHENCVLDCYALFAAWDNDNLYIAWQMVNTNDTWAREGDGPLSNGGRIDNVPLCVALSIDPEKTMTGRLVGGGMLWDKVDVVYETPIDRLFMMSGQAGQGTPAMFLAADAAGNTSYDGAYCKNYAQNGITYKMGEAFCGNTLLYLNNPQAPADVYSNASTWVNLMDAKSYTGLVQKKHNTKYDSFYEMKIPFATLGITKDYILENGIGAMMVATRGESGIDCLPHDPSMLDNVYGDYIHDKSTSAEKSDSDTIRCQLADIGRRRASSAAAPAPEAVVSIAQDYTFHADALMLSVRLKNAAEGTYQIGEKEAVVFQGNTAFSVGTDLGVGESVRVTVRATQGENVAEATYTYTKGEGFSVQKGTALLLNEGWEECYCYMYQGGEKQNAKWPGVKMNEIGKGFMACTMPAGWSSANVIFNNGKADTDGKEQYPSGNGLTLGKTDVRLYDWVRWYDVLNTPPTGIDELQGNETPRVRKVVVGGQVYLVLPTGEMFTLTGKAL